MQCSAVQLVQCTIIKDNYSVSHYLQNLLSVRLSLVNKNLEVPLGTLEVIIVGKWMTGASTLTPSKKSGQ